MKTGLKSNQEGIEMERLSDRLCGGHEKMNDGTHKTRIKKSHWVVSTVYV